MPLVAPCPAADLPAAARLLFRGADDADARAARFAQLVRSGELDLNGLLLAKENGTPVGLAVVQHLPGGSAVVLSPAPPGTPAADALAAAVVDHLRSHSARIANVFLAPADTAHADPLVRRGFRPAAAIAHMVRPLADLPPAPTALRFEPADREPLLGETLLATYVGSLDVPEASVPRPADSILAGYRGEQAGPPHWWLARTASGDVVGLVILVPPRHLPVWELGYLGVVPAHRGHGYGEALLRFALHACRRLGGEHLSLSVDTRNAPAVAIYHRAGFLHLQEQRVFLWRADW